MKFKLGLLNAAQFTGNDLAMGSYRQYDSWQEERSRDPAGLVGGGQAIDVGVGRHSKYGSSTSSSCSLTVGCAHTQNACKYFNKLDIVSSLRGGPAGCGCPRRGRSPSTSSSDSSATNSTTTTDFDSSSSGSDKSIASRKGNGASSPLKQNISKDFASNASSSSSGSVSSDSNVPLRSTLLRLRGDVSLPNFTKKRKKKRRVCGGEGCPSTPSGQLLLSRLPRRSGRSQDTPQATKISSLNIKLNIFNGKTNNSNLKPDISKAGSLNVKTNSLSSNSSCDSKASSSSTKSLRSLFSRGNLFSSSFTFGKSTSSSVEGRARLPNHSAVTNTNIVIIGDKGVGKSAVTVRFLTRRYIGEYSSDNEMEYQHSTTVDHMPAHLHLLDAATPQAPHQILRHLSWADAFIVVYDVTSRTSFVHARQLLHVLHTHTVDYQTTGSYEAKTKDWKNKEGPHSLEDAWTCTASPTHSLSGLRHTNNGQDPILQKGHKEHVQNDQDPLTWGGPDTHSWSCLGVSGHSVKTHVQSGHTRLKYDHASCKATKTNKKEPNCRYCTTSNSSLMPSPAVLSQVNFQRHNHAPDYTHPRPTSNSNVDNFINCRPFYRHHNNLTTSQSHTTDRTIQYKSHDPLVHIQNSAHPLVLASLHSTMSITQQEQEMKTYESSCHKNISSQINLQNPGFQIQMKYPHQSLPQHSSSRAHRKDQGPNHSLLNHGPKQSNLRDWSPSLNYNPQGLDPSHIDGSSYLRDNRRNYSHLRSNSPDYSSQRNHCRLDCHESDHSHLKGHGPSHSHLRSYTTLLLGNKRDLEHYRCVWTDEGEALSLEFSCQFYEVSAAESVLGVHLAFHSLLKEARALQYIRSLPQPSAKASKSVVSSAVSKVIGNFFTKAGKTIHKD